MAVGLALAQVGAAQAYTLAGTWQGSLMLGSIPCAVQTVYVPTGTYSELMRCGATMTRQAGTYVLRGNLLLRSVESWDPRTQWIVDLCPGDSSRPGCGHWQQLSKPPGGTYALTFVDAGTVSLRDVNFGGQIVMRRVR
ncbi:MAG: hypothetical protein WAN59_00455 [Candidatus Baltobacteraceae bacterium]